MTRCPRARLVACSVALVALAATGAASAPPARAAGHTASSLLATAADASQAAASTPLRVTLGTLAPSTIPQGGSLTVTGRIVNESQETWSSLNVYLLTSPAPIRTRHELALAAATDADAEIGERRTDPGLFVSVGDLAPGHSVPYRLSVPRQDLGISGEPGVYWVGVHVLGASAAGRDTVADGRARTFMPLLPRPGSVAGERDRTRLALVVPFERWVRRGAAGRLQETDGWERAVRADGRLDRLLRLSGRAREPITWALDPALLDAVRSLAHGNPALDPTPARGRRDSSAEPSAGASPSESDRATPSGSDNAAGAGSEGDGAAAARRWLSAFARQAPRHSIVALPYGNLDAAAVLTSPLRALYDRARELSSETLARTGATGATPGLDPLDGYLPEAALRRADPGSVVILHREAFPAARQPVVTQPGRASVVLTDTAAGSGGPAPNSPYAALDLRQRLLSDAALHAMSARRDQPLVVSTPTAWDPGGDWSASGFFHGLRTPWLDLVDLGTVLATAPPMPADQIGAAPVYPDDQRAAQLPEENLRASRAVVRAGGVFVKLLTDNDTIDGTVDRIAMLASSCYARRAPVETLVAARGTRAYVRELMSRVRVKGPEFVMMSGESGPIQVTLVNGLDERVTVGLKVRTPGSDLSIEPVRPVTLGPQRRTSIRLEGRSHDIGVHSVLLLTTTADGSPLGSRTQFTVRTSNVSTVIWVVMAAGLALLLVAIVVRLVRRVRRRKATHGPVLTRERDPEGDPGPPPARPDQELRT